MVDALRGEEGQLVLPVQARRGDRRVRQPVERDVVEDVVSRQALGPPVEHARDQLVAAACRGRGSRPPGRRASPRSRTASAGGCPSPARRPGRACRRSRAGRTRRARRPRGRAAAEPRRGPRRRCRAARRRPCWCGCRAAPAAPRTPISSVTTRAPVAALRHESRRSRGAASARSRRARCGSGSQPVVGRLAGEPVARHRRDHHVERVRRAPAVRRGVGQRLDDLQLLDDRARATRA